MKEIIIVENPNGTPSLAEGENDVEHAGGLIQYKFGPHDVYLDQELLEKVQTLEKEASIIQYLCIFDFINNFINFSYKNQILILMCGVLSSVGYLGAKEFNEYFLKIYMTYNYITLVIKVLFLTVMQNPLLIVTTAFQVFLVFFFQRFIIIFHFTKNKCLGIT